MGINLGNLATPQSIKEVELPKGVEKVDRGEGLMSLNLSKGINLDLTKTLPSLQRVKAGLGWDVSNGQSMDLDVFALLLHSNGKIKDTSDVVYFGQRNTNKGVSLSEDNRTGEGDGDDETMSINLSSVPSYVDEVLIFVNIYNASTNRQNFGMVNNAYIRLVNEDTNKEEAIYILNEEGGLYTAFKFAGLKRNNGNWEFKTYGEGTHGSVNDIVNLYA